MTWRWQRLSGRCCTEYGWLADRHSTSAKRRWQIASAWWRRAGAAHAYYAAHRPSPRLVPSWFSADLTCIGIHEEGGQNSVAGYFGFIYPPSAYGEYGYGDSWLNWPRSAQELVAYHLYQRYGWSPWSTAPGCGL